MSLFLALSCLQGRPMQMAAQDLLQLKGVDGLQCTPGNAPTVNFQEWLEKQSIQYHLHEGFDFLSLKQKVWSEDYQILVSTRSLHPPLRPTDTEVLETLKSAMLHQSEYVFEIMYPPYFLSSEADLRWAMQHSLKLALDISHLHILYKNHGLSFAMIEDLIAYPFLAEIHLSDNDGEQDSHRPLTRDSFLLDQLHHLKHLPWILECYMHKLSLQERQNQIEIILNLAN